MLKWVVEKINNFLLNNKALELVLDYKGQISYGRVSGLMCLLFSQAMAIAGLYFSNNEKALAYCSTISLQFLSAALALYIPSKASETLSKKWAPQISETVAITSESTNIEEVKQ